MKFSQFATDLDLEENGVWIDIGQGAKIKIARKGNPAYNKLHRDLGKPYKAQLRAGTMPADALNKIELKLLSQTVLLDWSGFEDDNSKPVKYSTEHAYDMLKGLKDFRKLVTDLSDEQTVFRREEADETGNG